MFPGLPWSTFASSSFYLQLHASLDPAFIVQRGRSISHNHIDFCHCFSAKGITRPLFAIYRKTLRLYDNKNYIGKYSEEEVVKLEELHAKYGHDWATIGNYLGRSAASVKDRCRLLRKNKKIGKFLVDMDRHVGINLSQFSR